MGYNSVSSISYLVPWVRGTDMNWAWGDSRNPLLQKDNVIFVCLPEHEKDMAGIQQSFPGGQAAVERAPDGRILYQRYRYSLAEIK